jgi:hypothetical protein
MSGKPYQMKINPEFLRNFWLEITPQRLIIFPTILFAWFYLLTLFDGGRWVFFYTSIYFFFFITGVWGAQRAAGTITSEIQGKTWLLQRLTSMKPWSMVWGKLFGGLIITWYGGVLCLLAFIYSQKVLFDDVIWLLTSENLLTANLYLIGSGLFCQIVGMISGMAHLKFNKFGDKLSSRNNGSLMGLIFGVALIVLVVGRVNHIPTITWYGSKFSSIYFAMVSLYLAVAWGLTGLYMLMRREFQMRCHPVVWLGFLIFIIFYIMGFEYSIIKNIWGEYSTELNRLTIAFLIIVFFVYGMMAWERTDGFGLRQFLLRLKYRRYEEAIYEFPRWVISAVISFVMAGILMVCFPIYSDVFTSPPLSPNGFIISLMCFMVRDLALILYFHISDKPKRAGLNSVVCLIFLYGLIPAIIFSADMDQFVYLFYPLYEPVSIWKSILPSLLQALILCTLVYVKWRASKFHQSKLQPC